VDDSLNITSSNNALAYGFDAAVIGARTVSSAVGAHTTGKLARLRVYDRVLDSTELDAHKAEHDALLSGGGEIAIASVANGEWADTDGGVINLSTTSFTPSDNVLLVLAVGFLVESAGDFSNDPPLAVAGGSLTWTRRTHTEEDLGGYVATHQIWTAPVTTGASMTITVTDDISAATGDGIHGMWEVLEVSDYNTGDPVGASASNTGLGNGAGALTLSGAPASSSLVLASRFYAPDGAESCNATPATGWTEISDLNHTNPGYSELQTQRRTGSTSTGVNWDDLSSGSAAAFVSHAVALEIKAAA
jgi:hypothetical protein